MFIIPNSAELLFSNSLKTSHWDGSVLHFYTNNYTPVYGSALTNFTSATSLPAQTLSFVTATIDGSQHAINQVSTAHTATYSGSSSQVCYGYYVSDSGGTNLLAAELLSSPITVTASGDEARVTSFAIDNYGSTGR